MKKIKTDEVDGDDPIEKEYRKQNKLLYKYKDQLNAELDTKELSYLLEYNNQQVPTGRDVVSKLINFNSILS